VNRSIGKDFVDPRRLILSIPTESIGSSIMTIGRLKILSIGLTTLFLGTISSAMSVSSECAVVGCGVLGTSLCKQFLEKHEFESTKGMY
jgi:hypothetical protein